ncbi:MAG: hypothetical protein V3S98_01910 [Dehalococcoidia bacterium]
MKAALAALVLLAGVAACSGEVNDTPTPAAGQVTLPAAQALLTADDLAAVGADVGGLDVSASDRRADAEAVNPALVTEIESWYAIAFQHGSAGPALFFSIIDFSSASAAQSHMDLVESGRGYSPISPPIGDRATLATPFEAGIGSALVFALADRVVLLHTTLGDANDALVDPEQMTELAETVADRLEP